MSDSNGKRRPVSIQLRPADIARLDDLAREAGMGRAAIVLTGVRRRLQIVRKEAPR